jgi:ubiquinone/menaquinone biosynthesis C-methylase UbiE
MRRLELRPGDRLLDVGCGTGVLLEAVCRRASPVRVTGLDLAMPMLRVAGHRLEAGRPLVAGDVMRLPFRTGTFQVIVSTSSFHYWSDPRTALAEIARVLAPAGRLVITDWCDDYLACHIYNWVLRRLDPAHQRAYSQRECAGLLGDAGYIIGRLDRYKIGWLWGLMTVTARRGS